MECTHECIALNVTVTSRPFSQMKKTVGSSPSQALDEPAASLEPSAPASPPATPTPPRPRRTRTRAAQRSVPDQRNDVGRWVGVRFMSNHNELVITATLPNDKVRVRHHDGR